MEVYEPICRLGTGSFGEVWACQETKTRELHACKVVSRDSDSAVESFRRETAALNCLSGQHEGIIGMRGVTEGKTHLMLALEFCSGGDLLALIQRRGRLPEASAKVVFEQVTSALAFCHSRGFMHGDVKPENILLESKAEDCLFLPSVGVPLNIRRRVWARLADFGFSVYLEPGMTTWGRTGSPNYVAPEVLRGEKFGKLADMWSLGVTLCVMLTGELPFGSEMDGDPQQTRQSVLCGKLDFGLPCWRGVSPAAQDLVRMLLRVDPTKRLRARDTLRHAWIAAKECGRGNEHSAVPELLLSRRPRSHCFLAAGPVLFPAHDSPPVRMA